MSTWILLVKGFNLITFFFLIKILVMFWGFIFPLKHALFALILFFVFYWVYSIFLFLYKRIQLGFYVSSLQRFWKRTLYLFWLIEFFLFFIYLFLLINAPNETNYLLDHKVLFTKHDHVTKAWFCDVRVLSLIIWSLGLMILYSSFESFSLGIVFIIFVIITRMVLTEFSQVFFLFNLLQNNTLVFSIEQPRSDPNLYIYDKDPKTGKHKLNLELLSPEIRKIEEDKMNEKPIFFEMYNFYWEQEEDKLRYRTVTFYFTLVSLLKFWHVVFIYVMFLMTFRLSILKVTWSLNLLSSNLQNFYFLFIFLFLQLLLNYKYYMQYFYLPTYFYFFMSWNTWRIFLEVFPYSLIFWEN